MQAQEPRGTLSKALWNPPKLLPQVFTQDHADGPGEGQLSLAEKGPSAPPHYIAPGAAEHQTELPPVNRVGMQVSSDQ